VQRGRPSGPKGQRGWLGTAPCIRMVECSHFLQRAFDSSRSSSERRNPQPLRIPRESPADGAQLRCQVGRKANIT
jgi:hypothetical protein